MRSSVVLPHPDGPSRVRNSPGSTRRSSARTAVVLPNRLETLRSSTLFACMVRAGARSTPACITFIIRNPYGTLFPIPDRGKEHRGSRTSATRGIPSSNRRIRAFVSLRAFQACIGDTESDLVRRRRQTASDALLFHSEQIALAHHYRRAETGPGPARNGDRVRLWIQPRSGQGKLEVAPAERAGGNPAAARVPCSRIHPRRRTQHL